MVARLYWLDQVGADDDLFGREFRSTSIGGALNHLIFAEVQLEATAEHPVTDGVHVVRNPDRKAFSLVWLALNISDRRPAYHQH